MIRVFLAAVAIVASSVGLSPAASADDADIEFIGGISNYFRESGTSLDSQTIKALIADAHKACAMSDAGFSYEASEFIKSKWPMVDRFGFMLSATNAYCPQHRSHWEGL
jgi:hypothetical protein